MKCHCKLCNTMFPLQRIVFKNRRKVFKNRPSKICGNQPLKNLKWYGLPKQTYHSRFFKGCLPQILLGPFLNTLSHIISFPGYEVNHQERISSDQSWVGLKLQHVYRSNDEGERIINDSSGLSFYLLVFCSLVHELIFDKFFQFHAPNWPVITSFAIRLMTGLAGYQSYHSQQTIIRMYYVFQPHIGV